MSDERFDRLEGMLATLIGKVGRMEVNFSNMQDDIKQLKGDSEHVKGDIVQIKREVGQIKGEVGQLKANVSALESCMNTIEKNQAAMREEIEVKFNVVDKKLDSLLAEQEFIWEKAVRTEREVGKMKNLLQL